MLWQTSPACDLTTRSTAIRRHFDGKMAAIFALLVGALCSAGVRAAAWSGIVIDGASQPVSQVFAPMLADGADNLRWQLDAGLPHRRGAVAVNYEDKVGHSL